MEKIKTSIGYIVNLYCNHYAFLIIMINIKYNYFKHNFNDIILYFRFFQNFLFMFF